MRSGTWAASSTSASTASTGTSRPDAATGLPITGRASPRTTAADHIRPAPARRRPLCERAQEARRRQGHAGRDLHGHGPGVAGGDACLHAARRAAHRRLRRLLGRLALRPHERHGLRGADHARRGLAARLDRSAEEHRRRGDGRRAGGPRCLVVRRTGTRCRCKTAATSGSTSSTSPTTPRPARASRWTRRICSSSCTRRGRPRSRRASCTRRAAISSASRPTHHYIFDLKPETDVYWCAADIGWITGHSYIVYGPLCNGATSRALRRHAGLPGQGSLVGDCRALRRHDPLHGADRDPRAHEVGAGARAAHDLTSLRLLGSVGEPINPEAWVWYREHIGGDRTPSSTPGGRPRPG